MVRATKVAYNVRELVNLDFRVSNSDVSCRSNPDVPSYCANTNMSSQISSVLWGGPPCQHTESEGLVTIFCIPRLWTLKKPL